MITSYWQVFIAEEDRCKTAFCVDGNKIYRYIRITMGLLGWLVQVFSRLQKECLLSWLFKAGSHRLRFVDLLFRQYGK